VLFRASVSVAILAVLAASGLSMGLAAAAPDRAPLATPSASLLAPFAERSGYSPSLAAEVRDARPASGPVEVVLTFESPNPAFYDPVAASAPALTTAQVGDAFGLSNASYAAVEQYFESRGLTVLHAWPDRLSLSLTGVASTVGSAFGTSLLSGTYEGRSVSFPATPPSLPAAFESEIAAVTGLSNGFDPFTLPSLAPLGNGSGPAPAQSNPANLVTPTDARDIYDVSGLYNLTAAPTYATGKGIALVLWGWGYSPSDLTTFFSDDYPSEFPAEADHIAPYPVDGAPEPSSNAPNDPSQGARELTLDLEWSGSMAPGATLDAVYAPDGPYSAGYSPTDPSMIDAINTAVDTSDVPNVAVISMSFGSVDGQDPSYQSAFETAFQQASEEHITLFAATGDTGGDQETTSGTCTGTPGPEYPAASTHVVAVGGTDVTIQRSVLGSIQGFSETAWSDSGGGYSVEYKAPSWQLVGSAAAPIEANGGYRGMPDVAATAAYNFLYYNGTMLAGAGTSFASPLWAGIVAEMDALRGSNFGFLDAALYTIASASDTQPASFHDITSGSNCIASAGSGWSAVTGWGSPDAKNLYEHLVSAFVNISVTASPTLIAPGGSVSISAVVTNATSGAPIATVPVVVTLGSNGIGGPCSGSFGSTTVDSNATGGATASFSVSDCYLGASAVATVVVQGNGYYGTASTTVSVNLLGLAPWLAPLAQYPANIVVFTAIMAIAIVAGAALGLPPAPESAPVTTVPADPDPSARDPTEPPPPAAPPPAPSAAPGAPPEPPPEAPVEGPFVPPS
jgi:kumamolisin